MRLATKAQFITIDRSFYQPNFKSLSLISIDYFSLFSEIPAGSAVFFGKKKPNMWGIICLLSK